MVRFSGLLQLRLFNGLCIDFWTVKGLVFELSSKYSLGYDGLLCGIFFGHLYATTSLEDQVSLLD